MPVSASPDAQATIPSTGSRGLIAAVTVGLVLLAIGIFISVFIGTGTIHDVWRAFFSGDTDTTAVLVRRRVPRAFLAVLVGAALAVSGVLMQALTRNPLADPGILGINAGAYTAVVLGVAFTGTTASAGLVWVAMAGAFVTSIAVFLIGTTGDGGRNPNKLVMSGVALAAVFAGVSFSISLLNSKTFDKIRFWQVGSLQNRDWAVFDSVWIFIVVGLAVSLALASSLNALALGDDLASTLGVNVGRIRIIGLIATTLLCGAATAAIGPITFLGLMVPHAVRVLVGPDHRKVLTVSVIAGPVLLLAADILGRLITSGEIPVGVMMAALGAPVLIGLTRRKRQRSTP